MNKNQEIFDHWASGIKFSNISSERRLFRHNNTHIYTARKDLEEKQGRNRPLDTPKRMIERREREGERGRKVKGEI